MKTAILSALVAAFAATAGFAATITTFTDLTSFETSVGAIATEDFNSVTTDTSLGNGTVTTVGDITITSTGLGNPRDRNFLDAPGFGGFDRNVDGTTYINLGLQGPNDSLTLTFGGPVLAFGADFNGVRDRRTEIVVAGETIVVSTGAFFGFTSDTAFTSLTFQRGFRDNIIGIDNVTTGTTPIPLPAGIVLLGTALAGLALRGRG